LVRRPNGLIKKMNKIRVIHVVYSFATGGLEKGIATVVRHAAPDFEHLIVCLDRSGETARLLPLGTRVIELRKPPGNSIKFLWRFAQILKPLQPAIIHARNWGGTDGILAARLAGIRTTIQGEHGWEIDDAAGLNRKRLIFRRLIEGWVREYTCVSRHLAHWLTDVVKARRPVTQIYNGIDTNAFAPDKAVWHQLRAEFGISESTCVIGIVGRLDPIKDHATLFQAFAALHSRHSETRLLVIGDGPERTRLEALAGVGVQFLGNRLDVAAVLQALDVFVLPSLNEGISNTILEAMATGLPVVATNVGGNPELVQDGVTGILIPSSDAPALSAGLLNYVTNPALRQAHGQQGRARAVQHFSIASMVTGYEAVYRRVAATR